MNCADKPEARDRASGGSLPPALGASSLETDSILAEITALDRAGKLDTAALAQFDERIAKSLEFEKREFDRQLAEIEGMYPQRAVIGLRQKLAIAFVVFVIVGIVLEMTIGDGFVCSYTNAYVAVAPVLFCLLLPAFSVMWFRATQSNQMFISRYPTWAVRWLVMFPLLVASSSAMVVLSPFGWVAVVGWAVGVPSVPKDAKVLAVGTIREQLGKCDQEVELDIDRIHARICVEERIVGPALRAGDTVAMVGKSSFLGYYIDQIRKR